MAEKQSSMLPSKSTTMPRHPLNALLQCTSSVLPHHVFMLAYANCRQAMGSVEDPELIKETFKFISTKARDQDVVYFFRGLSGNPKARRLLAQYFKEEYDTLYKRFEATFTLKSLVEVRNPRPCSVRPLEHLTSCRWAPFPLKKIVLRSLSSSR